jgi:hypothetical protein
MKTEKYINKIADGVSNVSLKQVVITIVVLIIVTLVIEKIFKPELKALRFKIFGAKTKDGSKIKDISESRKDQLRKLAQKLYDNIYCVFCYKNIEDVLSMINKLTDNEFVYLTTYYNDNLTENNVVYDVDWEILPSTTEDEKFINRYKSLKIPGDTGWLSPEQSKLFEKSEQSKTLGIVLILAASAGLIYLAKK